MIENSATQAAGDAGAAASLGMKVGLMAKLGLANMQTVVKNVFKTAMSSLMGTIGFL